MLIEFRSIKDAFQQKLTVTMILSIKGRYDMNFIEISLFFCYGGKVLVNTHSSWSAVFNALATATVCV